MCSVTAGGIVQFALAKGRADTAHREPMIGNDSLHVPDLFLRQLVHRRVPNAPDLGAFRRRIH